MTTLKTNTTDLQDILNTINELPSAGSGGVQVQSDWNENDETKASYVKNRPFWTGDPVETVLFDGDVVITEGAFYGESELGLEEGVEYNVNFNGSEYVLVGTSISILDMAVMIGNPKYFGHEDNGIPFAIVYGAVLTDFGDGTYPLRVSGAVAEIHKIDKKYLPPQVGLNVEGKTFQTFIVGENGQYTQMEIKASEGAEVFNDYVNNIATGYYSHTEGLSAVAVGDFSHAEGIYTYAMGACSHAEGETTVAEGNSSHAEGRYTIASGGSSHAEGYYTKALANQHAQGHYNDETKATAGSTSGTTGTAFVIGNGTSSAKSNAIRMTYEGQMICKKSYSTSGADYAEYFEWADGNTEHEDRVGYFVTFEDGEFIRKANEGEYLLGIVSGNPAVLGNHDECWQGQNEMDEWNRYIYVTETATDERTGETHEYKTYKLNPNYDATKEYIPRADRPEWDAIGMIGVLSVRDDGTCKRNGYCKVADGGIATHSEEMTNIRVLSRVNDNIIKVLLK